MDSRFFLVMMLGVASMGPVQAGVINGSLFFGKKPVKNPVERVPELIGILKTDGGLACDVGGRLYSSSGANNRALQQTARRSHSW